MTLQEVLWSFAVGQPQHGTYMSLREGVIATLGAPGGHNVAFVRLNIEMGCLCVWLVYGVWQRYPHYG